MPVTYNYACDDGLLGIMMVYYELRGFVIRDRLVKKGESWLPSVKAKHSTKRPFSIILRTFFAECFGFAECIPMDTR